MIGYVLLAVVAGLYAARLRSLPAWFWSLSVLLQAVVIIHIGAGGILYLGGSRPRRALHLLYGVLVLGTGFILCWLRPGGLLRRTQGDPLPRDQVLTTGLIALTQAALIMRAWMTGAGVGVP
jgi:hypothetical protein